MNKLFLLGLLSLGFSSAQASDGSEFYSKFPSTLSCKTSDKAFGVKRRKFTITKLDTQYPDANIYDTSGTGYSSVDFTMSTVLFSNECDNSYELTFSTQDMIRAKKSGGTVRALLVASFQGEKGETTETHFVTCQ